MIAKSGTTHIIGLGHGIVLLIFPRLGNNSDGIHVVGDMDYWNSGGGCDCERGYMWSLKHSKTQVIVG